MITTNPTIKDVKYHIKVTLGGMLLFWILYNLFNVSHPDYLILGGGLLILQLMVIGPKRSKFWWIVLLGIPSMILYYLNS